MTINQTPITDQLEEFLIAIGPTNNDHIGYVFASAFAFDEPFQQVSKLQALTLKHYILANNVKSVLEVGTFVGFSAFSMASGLSGNRSKITSLEVNEGFHKQALQNQNEYRATGAECDGIIERINFICTDAYPHITEKTDEYSKYDMVFLDGDKENYSLYVQWFIDNAKSGAHLLIDNILFKGSILGDGKYAKGIKRAIETVKSSQQLVHYVVPVGDCMLVVRKK